MEIVPALLARQINAALARAELENGGHQQVRSEHEIKGFRQAVRILRKVVEHRAGQGLSAFSALHHQAVEVRQQAVAQADRIADDGQDRGVHPGFIGALVRVPGMDRVIVICG